MKNANPFRALRVAAPLAIAAVALVGCARETPRGAAVATAAEAKGLAEFFPINVGGQTVRMQLAVRSEEMQKGLMGRRDLGRDDGMIFIYERPQSMSFWMHNTPTPLDIGFFDGKGVLQEIYPLHPFDESPVPSRSADLQFALEMNQGWFRDRGIKPGAELDRRALAAALKARGFDPKKFGL